MLEAPGLLITMVDFLLLRGVSFTWSNLAAKYFWKDIIENYKSNVSSNGVRGTCTACPCSERKWMNSPQLKKWSCRSWSGVSILKQYITSPCFSAAKAASHSVNTNSGLSPIIKIKIMITFWMQDTCNASQGGGGSNSYLQRNHFASDFLNLMTQTSSSPSLAAANRAVTTPRSTETYKLKLSRETMEQKRMQKQFLPLLHQGSGEQWPQPLQQPTEASEITMKWNNLWSAAASPVDAIREIDRKYGDH